MPTSVKEISAAALEAAVAGVISKLTGKDCSVSVSEIKYNSNGFTSTESLSFSASSSCTLKETGGKIPF